jgi:hypothetical protein
MPLAIVGTRYSSAYRLLDAGYAIPLGLLLGAGGLWLASSANRRNERALGRLGGERTIRWARMAATTGICFAVTCLISVGVYAFLQHVGNSK